MIDGFMFRWEAAHLRHCSCATRMCAGWRILMLHAAPPRVLYQ